MTDSSVSGTCNATEHVSATMCIIIIIQDNQFICLIFVSLCGIRMCYLHPFLLPLLRCLQLGSQVSGSHARRYDAGPAIHDIRSELYSQGHGFAFRKGGLGHSWKDCAYGQRAYSIDMRPSYAEFDISSFRLGQPGLAETINYADSFSNCTTRMANYACPRPNYEK